MISTTQSTTSTHIWSLQVVSRTFAHLHSLHLHLLFILQTGHAVGGFDMNVREAWLLGYAGRGVSISILDDGIQRDHLDLAANYDPLASTDINDHDDDPTPQANGDNKQAKFYANIKVIEAAIGLR